MALKKSVKHNLKKQIDDAYSADLNTYLGCIHNLYGVNEMGMKRMFDEEDLLNSLSVLIDRLFVAGESEFRNTDMVTLRSLERYLCDQIVTHRLQT